KAVSWGWRSIRRKPGMAERLKNTNRMTAAKALLLTSSFESECLRIMTIRTAAPRTSAATAIRPSVAFRISRPPIVRAGSAAAGVVAAAAARVAAARALHHAAALLTGRAEVEAGHLGRDHRGGFGES